MQTAYVVPFGVDLALVRFFADRLEIGHFEVLYSVNVDAARKSFSSTFFWDLTGNSIESKISDFKERVDKNRPDFIHLEWFHDVENQILEIAEFLEDADVRWTTTGSVSHVLRSSAPDSKLKDCFEQLEKYKMLQGIFVWDIPLTHKKLSKYPTLLPLLDWQDLSVMQKTGDCCSWVLKKKSPIVGLVGQLYGYRGVNLLLKFWFRNPSRRIYLAGRFFPKSYSKGIRLLIFFSRLLDRLYLEPNWLETSSEINHHLKHLDALVIDTISYPQPSGIATRARGLGIPILIPESNSYLNDLAAYDTGIQIWNFKIRKNKELKRVLLNLKNCHTLPGAKREDQLESFLKGWSSKF